MVSPSAAAGACSGELDVLRAHRDDRRVEFLATPSPACALISPRASSPGSGRRSTAVDGSADEIGGADEVGDELVVRRLVDLRAACRPA